MRVLVISDVHGNLPALEFVLNKEKESDLVISLGDVVNYGPWSNECVQLIETIKNKILIMGNHEEAFLKGSYEGKHPVAQAFFDFCYPSFTNQNQISAYIEKYEYKSFTFTHTLNNTYIYSDTELALSQNTFIGHSHRPFKKNIGNFQLINVGSVGQNRINADELNYAVWTTESNLIELKAFEFSADKLLNEMQSRKYPEICMSYIQSKRNKN